VIVVDASALVAILAREPEREAFLTVLTDSQAVLSPIGYWEAAVAARRALGNEGAAALDALLASLNIEIRPAFAETARAAVEAETLYGKRTAARLNLGDCFAYALAKELDAPLLYKGADFTETDIAPAV
jgi:ribonuclease VapC